MPVFVMPIGKPFECLDAFTQGYVEAMFFTDRNVDSYGNLADATFSDLAPEALIKIMKDCETFQRVNAALLEQAYERDYDETQAGHDYWLTRNGHGPGFWDRKVLECQPEEYERLTAVMVANRDDRAAWGKALAARQVLQSNSLGERLSNACRGNSVGLYRVDDGKVYVSC